MATASGESIIARSRVAATMTGGDANVSPVIDSKSALRVLLNNAIRGVYRQAADNQKFIRDTVTRHTVVVSGGTGACPDEVMREFLPQAQFQDDNSSLISYFDYNIDQDSGTTYDQLGYVVMQGDDFKYRAPSTTSYSGNLYVTVASFPDFPASLASNITFPSAAIVDDIVLALSFAIRGEAT